MVPLPLVGHRCVRVADVCLTGTSRLTNVEQDLSHQRGFSPSTAGGSSASGVEFAQDTPDREADDQSDREPPGEDLDDQHDGSISHRIPDRPDARRCLRPESRRMPAATNSLRLVRNPDGDALGPL